MLAHTDSSVATPADLPTDLDWVPVVWPGGVHEALIAAGKIPHPYVDEHEDDALWIEERTWWYRLPLAGPASVGDGQRVRLVLPSVDTVASVWLNGELVGDHANAFRPFVVDVTALVRIENELIVRIAPPLDGLVPPIEPQQSLDILKAYVGPVIAPGPDQLDRPLGLLSCDARIGLRRKPTLSWGWDFGPYMPAVGVLVAPELLVETEAVLTGSHVRALSATTSLAVVAIDVEADAFATDAALRAAITLTAPGGTATSTTVDIVDGRGSVIVDVATPHLWWTHDLGEPALYDVKIELRDGNATLDTSTCRAGLRTISVDRSPDTTEGGRLFRFTLNGVPIYARGANWLPPSMLRGSVSPEEVRDLITIARDGNQNMLRIWGGGMYEQDAFYDACDELGVLVWQDFMFACFDYPSADQELQQEVAREAAFQVARLRNHPSIALWCGNNEIETVHSGLTGGSLEPGNWGWHIFHGILPDAVQRYSPGTFYWPGSPWGEDDPAGPNGAVDGDRHYWDVWHGISDAPPDMSRGEAMHWKHYEADLAKFGSEFGIQAAPAASTLARWVTEPLEVDSRVFKRRIKDLPKTKGRQLIKYELGQPDSLEQYIEFSMACQAEGLKFGIEHYRRRQPHNSGSLVWQYNDVWPGFSWSVVDYDHVPKAGYYFLQRVFAQVLTSFKRTDTGVELWVTNSGQTDVPLELQVQISGFDGTVHLDEKVAAVATAYSSQPVWSSSDIAADRIAWVSDAAGITPANRLFFAQLKDLPLGDGRVEAEFVADDVVRLRSTGYSYFARLEAEDPRVRFSTNFVDLRDGDSVDVRVSGLAAGGQLVAKSWGQEGGYAKS